MSRNAMCFGLIMIMPCIAALAAVSGCESASRRQATALSQQQMQLAQQQMELVARINESVAGYGAVSLESEPAGAAFRMDDAEILGDPASLTIPVGVHEFTAVWPDGATATRRVVVPQMQVTYDLSYESKAGASGGRMQHAGTPDVRKTVIVLTKPNSGS